MKKRKNGVIAVMALALAAVVGVRLFSGAPEAIEDTNGPDNTALAVITDEQIENLSMGMTGGITVRDALADDSVVIESDGFTGVYELFSTNLLGQSDIDLRFSEFAVTEGNMKAAVVLDGKIVGELPSDPEGFSEFYLADVNGRLQVILAGESAAFRAKMPKVEYEQYN